MAEACLLITQEVDGVRRARRQDLAVPLNVATGRYELLSDLALRELTKDLMHEQMRRQGWLS
jgi:hypothetical protein